MLFVLFALFLVLLCTEPSFSFSRMELKIEIEKLLEHTQPSSTKSDPGSISKTQSGFDGV